MIIKVKVIAGVSKILVDKLEENSYKVKLTASAERGRANEQLKKVLAGYFGVSSGTIEIVKGFNRTNKIIKVI